MDNQDNKMVDQGEQTSEEISLEQLDDANGGWGIGAVVKASKVAYKVGYWVGTKIN